MAVKRGNMKSQDLTHSFMEELLSSDLPHRLTKIVEQSGLSPLNLFQKWVLQEEFTIGIARNSQTQAQAPKKEVKAPLKETPKKNKPEQLPKAKEQKEAATAAAVTKPQPQSPEYRKALVKRAEKLKKEGMAKKKIAEIFNEEKVPTLSGTGKWYGSSISLLLSSK